MVAWTPDSHRIVFLSSRMSPSFKEMRAFAAPLDGGLAETLPFDHAGRLSYGPNGRVIAFNRIFRNLALPKRYVGGQAQDIDSLADPAGHWTIENTGVPPDVAVEDRPEEAVTAQDIQLETAVRVALMQLRARPRSCPGAAGAAGQSRSRVVAPATFRE